MATSKKKTAEKKPSARPDETPRQRFERLAPKRVNKALKAIGLIRNLAGPGYDWSEEDVKKIMSALASETEAVLFAFQKKAKKGPNFTL